MLGVRPDILRQGVNQVREQDRQELQERENARRNELRQNNDLVQRLNLELQDERRRIAERDERIQQQRERAEQYVFLQTREYGGRIRNFVPNRRNSMIGDLTNIPRNTYNPPPVVNRTRSLSPTSVADFKYSK